MWFYIDENGDFELARTESEALAGAKRALDECRPGETNGICWGVLYSAEHDLLVDYVLADVEVGK